MKMKAIVLEVRNGVAAVLREDGVIVKTRQKCAVGDTIDVTFMRNERGEYTEHTVSVTLGEKPEGVRTK